MSLEGSGKVVWVRFDKEGMDGPKMTRILVRRCQLNRRMLGRAIAVSIVMSMQYRIRYLWEYPRVQSTCVTIY